MNSSVDMVDRKGVCMGSGFVYCSLSGGVVEVTGGVRICGFGD
jgi:hypothetical protein